MTTQESTANFDLETAKEELFLALCESAKVQTTQSQAGKFILLENAYGTILKTVKGLIVPESFESKIPDKLVAVQETRLETLLETPGITTESIIESLLSPNPFDLISKLQNEIESLRTQLTQANSKVSSKTRSTDSTTSKTRSTTAKKDDSEDSSYLSWLVREYGQFLDCKLGRTTDKRQNSPSNAETYFLLKRKQIYTALGRTEEEQNQARTALIADSNAIKKFRSPELAEHFVRIDRLLKIEEESRGVRDSESAKAKEKRFAQDLLNDYALWSRGEYTAKIDSVKQTLLESLHDSNLYNAYVTKASQVCWNVELLQGFFDELWINKPITESRLVSELVRLGCNFDNDSNVILPTA
jgi:hypothetical protein